MVKIICTENGGNNRTAVALSGGMDLVVSQIGYAIKTIYTNVRAAASAGVSAASAFGIKTSFCSLPRAVTPERLLIS